MKRKKKPGRHERPRLLLTRSAMHVSAYQAAVQGPHRGPDSNLSNVPQSTLKYYIMLLHTQAP